MSSAPSNVIGQISASYDNTIAKVQQLSQKLAPIFGSSHQQLEDKMDKKEYLQLLAHLMYTLQSSTYLYTAVSQKQMPAEFVLSKVEDYFKRVQHLGTGKQPTQKVNKEAAQRIIKRL